MRILLIFIESNAFNKDGFSDKLIISLWVETISSNVRKNLNFLQTNQAYVRFEKSIINISKSVIYLLTSRVLTTASLSSGEACGN